MSGVFNNPAVVAQSWYVVGRARDLRRGAVFSRELLGRRLALFRGEDGRARAVDARCAHLGADLGRGAVVGNTLRCAFHHWTYTEDGLCRRVPYMDEVPKGAQVASYPVVERHGCLWLFAGPRPYFPLPAFDGHRDEELRVARLPPRRLACHPHLAVMNGLDIQHFRTVHGFDFTSEPIVRALDEFRVQARLQVRLRARGPFAGLVRAIAGEVFSATFTTWGGNMATIEGRAGSVPVLVLFTHRPVEGGSASQTFLFVPRARGLRRWAGLEAAALAAAQLVLAFILAGDRDVLDTLAFRGNLVPADAPLLTFIRQVNAMPVMV